MHSLAGIMKEAHLKAMTVHHKKNPTKPKHNTAAQYIVSIICVGQVGSLKYINGKSISLSHKMYSISG